jgi:hypothetical protein
MADWTSLSAVERNDIEHKLIAALNSIGIKVAVTRWNVPSQLPHWQLLIETSWCKEHIRSEILIALDQAMARADVQAPINGVILKSHKEK